MEKYYYLDNAATTKPFDEEFDLLKENNAEGFFNPSASYAKSINVKKKLEEARKTIVDALRGSMGKLLFTSSATESNNTVFEGLHLRKGQVVLISKGEHPAVFNAAHRLEQKGIIVKEIPLTTTGVVDENEFKKLMTNEVALVSVIHVSNETGAINDIKSLCTYAKSVNKNVVFHSDGVQAFCKIKVNLIELGVDLYSISAHKVYAPRGIAGLWIKKGVVIDALLVGGGQEDGLRSSTENVDGAIAFAYAVKRVSAELQENFDKVLNFRKSLVSLIEKSEAGKFLKVNENENNSPYVLSLTFDGIKGEVLMYGLEADGVLISTGSACSAKKAGNRILEAMGRTASEIVGSVRISFSPYMEYDMDYIAEKIVKNVMRFQSNNIVKK